MAQKKEPGYPLPSGELGEDEIVCQLVYLPNRSEYWQALLAAIHYMSTWRAWERDDDKRGKDAASNWREAFELTIGCWRMTCLDDLIADVDAIRNLMEKRKDCCDDNITYGLQDEEDSDIEPGVGDPPDEYGETAIETWEDWEEHVCYNAHLYVDNLKNMGLQLWHVVKEKSLYLGLIAAGLVLLSFAGVGLPIAYLLASSVVAGIALSATLATFADTPDEIEDARNEIVCAFLQGGDLAAVIESALSSGAAWDLFYQFIDYDSAMAIIHEGGIEGDYLPSETRDDCTCEYEFERVWPFDSEVEEPWVGNNHWSAPGQVTMDAGDEYLESWAGAMRLHLGLSESGSFLIHRVKFNYGRTTDNVDMKFVINHEGGNFIRYLGDTPPGQAYVKEYFFDPPLLVTHPQNPFILFDQAQSNCWMWIDYVELDMDSV